MRKQEGFSLIELLIVVAIILIIAAIAIPNLLRARIASNESSAAASIRTIDTAELSYQNAYPDVGYPATLAILGPADSGCTAGPSKANACIIDFVLAQSGVTAKSGYNFTAVQVGAAAPFGQFFSTAQPVSASTGVKAFCGADDNVVRYETPAAAIGDRATCLGLTAIGQ